jgi:hypothetical protein
VIKKCYKNPISSESKVSSTQSEQIQATDTFRQLKILEAFLQHMGLAPVHSHATISGLTIDHFLECCSSKIVQKQLCGSSSPLCFLMDDDHDDTSSGFLLLPFPFATSLEATRENDNGRRQQTSCKPCRESSPNQFFLRWFSIAGEEK